MSKSKGRIRDSIKGALYGFAIGDAMGATTEFMSQIEIRAKYGTVEDIIGGGWLNLKPGEVTDDTQMSICVMNALMHSQGKRSFAEQVGANFIEWYKSNPPDIGNQCRMGIARLMAGEPLSSFECPTALGNGSLMRALPCALVGNYDYNVIQGRLTHPSVKCATVICRYTMLIDQLIEQGCSERLASVGLEEPTGYIDHTYNNALHWAAHYNLEACIIGAVNHGGDADTIAAIAGSIAGAEYGFGSIPRRWIEQLKPEIKSKLDEFEKYVVKTRGIEK